MGANTFVAHSLVHTSGSMGSSSGIHARPHARCMCATAARGSQCLTVPMQQPCRAQLTCRGRISTPCYVTLRGCSGIVYSAAVASRSPTSATPPPPPNAQAQLAKLHDDVASFLAEDGADDDDDDDAGPPAATHRCPPQAGRRGNVDPVVRRGPSMRPHGARHPWVVCLHLHLHTAFRTMPTDAATPQAFCAVCMRARVCAGPAPSLPWACAWTGGRACWGCRPRRQPWERWTRR